MAKIIEINDERFKPFKIELYIDSVKKLQMVTDLAGMNREIINILKDESGQSFNKTYRLYEELISHLYYDLDEMHEKYK